MKNSKIILSGLVAVFALGFIGCSDDEGTTLTSVTAPPTSMNITFSSNEEAVIEFDPAVATQSTFDVKMTDQFGEVAEVIDAGGSSPITISGFPKGMIYTVEMAAGTASAMGDYGDKTEPMLASAKEDVNNMNRIDMLNAINDARAETRMCGGEEMQAVAPLNWDDKLETAALIHTVDMNDNNFFAHTSATDNSSPGDRITKEGYNWSYYGENIHKGSVTAQAAVASWLTSPPHCKNIMSPNFKEVGAANKGTYWTQNFGTSR